MLQCKMNCRQFSLHVVSSVTLQSFVTSTKLHVKESLWLLFHRVARSMRSDPSWWLESRWGPIAAAGTGASFTSIQNVVLMRLSSLQVNAMLRGHLVSRLFQVNSYLWGELHDRHGPQAGWYPISCLPHSFPDLQLHPSPLSLSLYPHRLNCVRVRSSLLGWVFPVRLLPLVTWPDAFFFFFSASYCFVFRMQYTRTKKEILFI